MKFKLLILSSVFATSAMVSTYAMSDEDKVEGDNRANMPMMGSGPGMGMMGRGPQMEPGQGGCPMMGGNNPADCPMVDRGQGPGMGMMMDDDRGYGYGPGPGRGMGMMGSDRGMPMMNDRSGYRMGPGYGPRSGWNW